MSSTKCTRAGRRSWDDTFLLAAFPHACMALALMHPTVMSRALLTSPAHKSRIEYSSRDEPPTLREKPFRGEAFSAACLLI